MIDETELQQLKQELQGHLEAAARLQGKQTALLEQLHERFGIDSLAEACDELKRLEAEVNTVTGALSDLLDKLAEHEEKGDARHNHDPAASPPDISMP